MPPTTQTLELLQAALAMREHAYVRYSGFRVGAAVLTASGDIFGGCNIENATFAATICAERVAVYAAMAAGHRSFTHLALVADQPKPLSPCGICRQVLAELAPGITVIMGNAAGEVRMQQIEELLPIPFQFPERHP